VFAIQSQPGQKLHKTPSEPIAGAQ
jgi:hypothetical protein